MRKQFFRRIDSVLPRPVALIPYQCALWALRAFIGIGMKCWVWNRNSTRNGAFIFGVSDLDVTVVARSSISFEFLNYALATLRRVFIFLGETNLYHYSHLSVVLPRMNAFELKRDPDLQKFHPVIETDSQVDKFVFTQRMLFADIFTLAADSSLRQSKWKNHFELIGYPHHGKNIDLKFVTNALKELCDHNSRVSEALEMWLLQVFKPGFNPYHSKLGEGFRILAPHCHLWFHLENTDKEFLDGLNQMEREIIKAQINWEFWGLYCQRYNIDRQQILNHLNRLQKAYACIVSKEESKKLEQDIALAF